MIENRSSKRATIIKKKILFVIERMNIKRILEIRTVRYFLIDCIFKSILPKLRIIKKVGKIFLKDTSGQNISTDI